jgi:2-hydroxy-4-carboxymuconate semialdehyde hemiacetal dehydrogenase
MAEQADEKLGICVIGHGMMGTWHARAFKQHGCSLRCLVGRRPEQTQASADLHAFARWTTNLEEALAADDVDIVVVANPSELHARTALLALQHDKHVLVEIPIAMTLLDSDHIVRAAAERDLMLGAVHPLRARTELAALHRRVEAGEEFVRHVGGRFFIHRLENVGATGYRRSWTDNLLWHHMAHLVDAGMWLLGAPQRRIDGFMPSPDVATGIPMDVALSVETTAEQSLVCTGSYYGQERIFDLLVITDRDSYRLDVFGRTLTTRAGTVPVASEEATCARLTAHFANAVRTGGEVETSGLAVLPAMLVLQRVQDMWDKAHGVRSLPGRHPKPAEP